MDDDDDDDDDVCWLDMSWLSLSSAEPGGSESTHPALPDTSTSRQGDSHRPTDEHAGSLLLNNTISDQPLSEYYPHIIIIIIMITNMWAYGPIFLGTEPSLPEKYFDCTRKKLPI